MKILKNGQYIKIENEQDKEDMLYLECVCGHLLSDHRYHLLVGSKKDYEIGRCLAGNHCGQFKMTGKIEPVKGYAYA